MFTQGNQHPKVTTGNQDETTPRARALPITISENRKPKTENFTTSALLHFTTVPSIRLSCVPTSSHQTRSG